jgi:glycosyltransferase involved in cell wall biosynthesis
MSDISTGTPEATIVVTTRDRPQEATRAVESALGQTIHAIEVVVIDDGSAVPFRTAWGDQRVRVLRSDEALGVSAARNIGLRAAHGRFVVFLDDDDELVPHMLEVSLRAVRESTLPQPVAVLSGIELVDSSGTTLQIRLPVSLPRGSHYFLEEGVKGNFQTHNTLVAPRQVLESIGGWDEHLRASVHDDFFLRLNAACSLVGVPKVTYRMTDHQGPRVSKSLLPRAEAMERTLAKHGEIFAQHPRRRAAYLGTIGVTYLRGGAWGKAVAAAARSLILDLRRPRAYLWLAACLAGPRTLRLVRRLRRPQSSVPRQALFGGRHK